MRLSTSLILFFLIQWSLWVTGFKPLETLANQMTHARQWAE